MTANIDARLFELFDDIEGRLHTALARIDRLCRSSLEVGLGRALVLCQLQFGPAVVVPNATGAPIGHGLYIVPQFRILNYASDFGLFLRSGNASSRLLVEADGAYWHTRSAEQRDHDSRRDTRLMRAGWPVLRFSESRITEDAAECAAAVWERLYGAWRMKTHCLAEFTETPA